MIKVYFRDSSKNERPIGEANNKKEAFAIIKKFLKDRNYECHYMRSWTDEEDRMVIDVGSWTEFFILDGVSLE